MPNNVQGSDGRWLRRLVGGAACVAVLLLIVLGIPRLGARSPVAILALGVLAVLTMRLVEGRVRRWFDRWAEREAARRAGPR